MSKYSLLSIIFFIFSFNIFSQKMHYPHFYHLTKNDGLSNNHILCIEEDKYGYIWIGTRNGLNRYDGHKFKVYKTQSNDTKSISNNDINCLYVTNDSVLLIGTENGFNQFNYDYDNFDRYLQKDSSGNVRARCIIEDSFDQYWIGTMNGIYIFSKKIHKKNRINLIEKNKYISEKDLKKTVVHNMINSLLEDSYKNIWIGTSSGLSCYNPFNKKFRHYTYSSGCTNCISTSNIRELYEDSERYLWIGTAWKGINRIDLGNINNPNMVIEHFNNSDGLVGNRIRAIYEDKNKEVWIGSELGLHIFDRSKNSFYYFNNKFNNSNDLNDQSILCMTVDHHGSLWIGTYIGGINVCNSEFQKHISIRIPSDKGGSLNIINCFAEDKKGNIWIGSKRGGLHFMNYPDYKLVNYSEEVNTTSQTVEALMIDRSNNIWFANLSGITLINVETGKTSTLSFKFEKKNLIVKDIYEDLHGKIWISSIGHGIFCIDRKKMKLADTLEVDRHLNSIGIRNVYKVIEGQLNDYWIATDQGVLNYNAVKGEYKLYNQNKDGTKGLRNNMINVLYFDYAHNLWIGTDNGLHIKSKTSDDFLVIDDNLGLNDNIIYGILQDKSGNIWVSTANGISKISFTIINLNDAYNYLKDLMKEDQAINNIIYNYKKIHGLENNEFNVRAALKLKSGELLFGGIGGFIIINPKQIKENTLKPEVAITNFYISNKLIDVNSPNAPIKKHISTLSEISLKHNHNTFAFDFTALNYINPEQNTFKCKLIGYDKDWIDLGTDHSYGYTKVPRGKYVFRVIAANNDGYWNEEGASLSIKINPPMWKTWWAYSIYSLFIFYLIFVFTRLVWNLKVTRLERDKINQVDLMKVRFFTNISHELRTPLTLIKTPIENMLKQEKVDFSLLRIISKNTDRLLKLVNQLLDFRKIETNNYSLKVSFGNISSFIENICISYINLTKDKNIKMEFISDPHEIFSWFDPDIIEKTLYNLLSNAIKYTPELGMIKVETALEQNIFANEGKVKQNDKFNLIIKVSDTGIGIPKEYSQNIFERFYQINNTSHQNTGSGLGLSLTKELIQLHKGKIELISNDEEESSGSTFIITLPYGDSAYIESEKVEQNFDKYMEEKNQELEVISNKKPSLLIVEDNSDMRLVLKKAFRPYFNIYEADNGESGWEKAVNHIPDIIFCDIVMHKRDGIELCSMIKKDERTNHIPVILLTALSSTQNKLKGLNTGADAYISKPFSIDLLKAQISTILRNRQKLIEKFDSSEKVLISEISAATQDQKFLNRIVNIIEENLEDTKFDVNKLISYAGIGRTVLYNKLNSLTGKSVNDFIQIIRLKKAARLIKKNEYSISQIAYAVGFNDAHYFSRCFKKYFGKSPSEYILSSG